jgi:hypothetical protein
LAAQVLRHRAGNACVVQQGALTFGHAGSVSGLTVVACVFAMKVKLEIGRAHV